MNNASTDRQAVIDIGSNSVRLVVYEGPRRAPCPICNEKSLCGLGRDVGEDGALNASSMESALSTLRRFKCLLLELGDPPVQAVATAAVREATNGREFVEEIRRIGFDIAVIDGAKEAALAALGVVSFEPNATGIVGDMGGGSLELVSLVNGAIGDSASLSIGPLRLIQRSNGDLKVAQKLIEESLERADWMRHAQLTTLYAVGGAWRSIARIHMQLRHHPLPVLHHYQISARQAIEICDLIARQSRSSLEEVPGISAKRLDTLPYAALVMKVVIQNAGIEKVFVSAGGVREGLLYDKLTDEERRLDPLYVGAESLASRLSPTPDYGRAVIDMIAPIFADETPTQARIRHAACLLIDIGAYFHPDMRGEHAFDTAIRAPFHGVTHPERAAIAYSLFVRHEGSKSVPSPEIVALISPEEQLRALRIGVAMRFAAALSPKAAEAIRQSRLSFENGALTLAIPKGYGDLMEELPRKRLEALAASFGRPMSINYF